MRRILATLLYATLAALTACGGSSSTQQQPQPTPAPAGIEAQAEGAHITVAWPSVAGADRYDVYIAHEPITSTVNYAAHQGGQWLQNVSSPAAFTAEDRAAVYHVVVTASIEGRESTPTLNAIVAPRYDIVGDGSRVLDVTTNLVWDRCLHGQQWNAASSNCDGEALRLTGTQIRSYATSNNRQPPRYPHLKTLVFCESGNPAYFPYTIHDSHQQNPCQGDADAPKIYTAIFPQEKTDFLYITDSDCSQQLNRSILWFLDYQTGTGTRCAGPPGDVHGLARFYAGAASLSPPQ